MQNCNSQNPWRPPDWRWQRAVDCLAGGPPPRERIDGRESFIWIKRSMKFLDAYRRCKHDERLLTELALRDPQRFWAHHLFTDESSKRSRFAVEAHILAHQTNRQIGYRTGCAEEYIESYEAMFFNVREKLRHTEYILNFVFGGAVARGLKDREYDLLWKLMGYFYGPEMLAAMINGFVNPQWVTRPDAVAGCFENMAINAMKKNAAIAAITVPVNRETQLDLINAFSKFVEIERNSDSAGQANDQILQNINAMLTSLPFGVGTRREDHAQQPGALQEYDYIAAELRSDELIRVATGYPLPEAAAIKNLAFPDSPRG